MLTLSKNDKNATVNGSGSLESILSDLAANDAPVLTTPIAPSPDPKYADLPTTVQDAIAGKISNGTIAGSFDATHTTKSGKTTVVPGVIMVTGDSGDWRPEDSPFDTLVVGASKKADNAFSRLLQVGAAVRGGCVMAVPVQATMDRYGIPGVKPARVVSGIQTAAFGLNREDFRRFDPVLRCVGTGKMLEGATAAYVLVRFYGFNNKAPKA